MAKKQTKKVEKKSTKKVSVKKLTPPELLKIRVDDEKRKYASLELKFLNLQSAYTQLELKLLELECKLKASQVDKIGDVVMAKSSDLETMATARSEFVDSIKSRHNISGLWGFDPKTGLIKED